MTMKSLIFTGLLSLSSLAMADLGTPLTAVKGMIHGADQRQVVGVNLEKVGMRAEQIVKLFHDIDPDKAVFLRIGPDGKQQAWWKPEKSENFHLRMTNPMSIGFEVRFVKDDKIGCGGYYEIVKIHEIPKIQDPVRPVIIKR